MFIYLITNTVNGKMYVGQTVQTAKKRWIDHKGDSLKPSSRPLLLAIKKYKPASFKVETLCKASTQEELDFLEKHFIAFYETYPAGLGKGYNMTPGGYGGGHNAPHRLEAKLKISKKNKGRVRSLEERAATSRAMKGVKITWGAKISATLKRKGITIPGYNLPRSAEVKLKMSLGCKARTTPAYCLLLSYVNTERTVNRRGFYGS